MVIPLGWNKKNQLVGADKERFMRKFKMRKYYR